MAEHTRRNKKTEPRDTPPSKEAKQQRQAGMKAAPRGEGEVGGTDRQPRQGSQRNEGHGPPPRTRRSYTAGSAPSDQGTGTNSAKQGSKTSGQQGLAASTRDSGSHATHGQRGAHQAVEEGKRARRRRG